MDLRGSGFVIWLTGMKRAGKSTLAQLLWERLRRTGRPVELIDEDGEASLLLEGLGGSKEDQARAVARVGFAAKLVARQGGIAICALLSPYRDARENVRRESRRFLEVFVDCDMATLERRDVESMYRRALAAEITQVAGINLPYEPPLRPEVVVRSDQQSPDEAARRVFQALVDSRLMGPAEFGRATGGLRPRRARRVGKVPRSVSKPSSKQAARAAPPKFAAARTARSENK